MGLVRLNQRLAEPSLQEHFGGIFPADSMANMRFSINFFTSIGLGGITDRQRELYKQVGSVFNIFCYFWDDIQHRPGRHHRQAARAVQAGVALVILSQLMLV
jgi:hypothetical protein